MRPKRVEWFVSKQIGRASNARRVLAPAALLNRSILIEPLGFDSTEATSWHSRFVDGGRSLSEPGTSPLGAHRTAGVDVNRSLRIASIRSQLWESGHSHKGQMVPCAPAAANRRRVLDRRCRSDEIGKQRAGVTDIVRGLAALDQRQDRLEQRAGIVGRTRVAPQPGEVGRGA
jgi:hypothetical protein